MKIKLSTSEQFVATSISETYIPSEKFPGTGRKVMTIENSDATESLDWYIAALTKPSALDKLTVTFEGEPDQTISGYSIIQDVARRVAADGSAYVCITLTSISSNSSSDTETRSI